MATASDKALFAFATGLASVLVVFAIWVVPVIPTNDGPQHVYAAHVSAHYDDPTEGYWRYYELAVPVTNTGFSAMFSVLEGFLPWRHALRATLTVIVLTWSWGFMSLVLAIDRRRWALGLLGFATALNWSFYMGFWNFVLAIGLGFATLGIAIRRRAPRTLDRIFVAVLLLLAALAHLVAAILTGAVIALVVLFRAPPERRVRELGLLMAMGAPVAAIVGLAARSTAALSAPGPTPSETLWVPFSERLAQVGACFVGGPAWRAGTVVAALGLGDVVARMRRREAASHEVALFVGAGLMTAAALTTPFHLRAWQFFSPRFLPFAVLGVAPLFAAQGRARRTAMHAPRQAVRWPRSHDSTIIASRHEPPTRSRGSNNPFAARGHGCQSCSTRSRAAPHCATAHSNTPSRFATSAISTQPSKAASCPTPSRPPGSCMSS